MQGAALGAAQQRLHLHAHDARPVETDPDRPPAERRVGLVLALHVGQHLVRADVEGAEDHRLVAGGIEDAGIERGEIGCAWARWRGSGTAARCGTGRRRARRISAGSAGRPSGRRSCRATASRRRGWSPACRAARHRPAAPRAASRPSRGTPWRRVSSGRRCTVAVVAVDQDGVAVRRLAGDARRLDHQRDRQRPGDDGGVAADRAFLEHHAEEAAGRSRAARPGRCCGRPGWRPRAARGRRRRSTPASSRSSRFERSSRSCSRSRR